MIVYHSDNFKKKLEKIKKKDKPLLIQIQNTLLKFVEDQKTPSLRIHKIKRGKTFSWSISVNRSIRILFNHIEDGFILHDIGNHDEIY
jgi:mRNA-degrading endonuclease YafQ of YafQ-DinJ toxin-antitoxin module